jgi:YD repeat-containing protein
MLKILEGNMKTLLYIHKLTVWLVALGFLLSVTACKKDNNQPKVTVAPPAPLATLGLYQYSNGLNKRIFVLISQVGTQKVNYASIFDTGSSGMTIDADGLIPATMITSSGIQMTGDSVVVNGITVTSRTGTLSYGDLTGITREYGNLAYTTVTIGDGRGSLTTKRIPIFLYYKIVDSKGNELAKHSADVFGVGPGSGYGNLPVSSPLLGFNYPANVTNGFKLAALSSTSFSATGTYVAGLLTVGLVPTDLTSSGFIMHPLTSSASTGYSPNIPATITYNNTSVAAQVLFDTGTPSISTIENLKETRALGQLPENSVVTVTTNRGFTYQYTTNSTGNLTEIQNPNISGDYRSVMSLDFFVDNLFLTDYTNHQIGLKNK